MVLCFVFFLFPSEKQIFNLLFFPGQLSYTWLVDLLMAGTAPSYPDPKVETVVVRILAPPCPPPSNYRADG